VLFVLEDDLLETWIDDFVMDVEVYVGKWAEFEARFPDRAGPIDEGT
jgi:hypothetical protein